MGRIALSCLLLLFALAQPAGAFETIEVGADSVLFSEIGALVRVTDFGVGGATLHLVDSITRIQIYGVRNFGTDEWSIPPIPVYLCPTFEMLPGLAWKFPDDNFGNARTAEAVRQESLTVPAGDFPNAWRVEVTRDDQPSVVNEVYWYAANVGLVQRTVWEGDELVSKSELMSYSVNGVGYFPLVWGNTWEFTDGTVELGARSVGSLKDLFQR